MIKRWWNKGEDENHEQETLVHMQTPENFLVIMELDQPSEEDDMDFPPDIGLVVPFASLSHFTHVLALNGIPYRTEPMS